MLTEEAAAIIAHQWIEAWNRHDLDAIASHYSDDVEFASPFVIKLLGDPAGTVRGKEALRDYFARGLAAFPQLNFELLQVLSSIDSLVLYYRSTNDLLAAEFMVTNDEGLITKVVAHYSAAP